LVRDLSPVDLEIPEAFERRLGVRDDLGLSAASL